MTFLKSSWKWDSPPWHTTGSVGFPSVCRVLADSAYTAAVYSLDPILSSSHQKQWPSCALLSLCLSSLFTASEHRVERFLFSKGIASCHDNLTCCPFTTSFSPLPNLSILITTLSLCLCLLCS